jgi:hypothetical protein
MKIIEMKNVFFENENYRNENVFFENENYRNEKCFL